MVSLLKMPRRWEDGTYNFGFGGLSTDTKPTKTWDDYVIANGSSFFEIDSLALSFYDKDTESWIKSKIEAGPHIITSDNITADAKVSNTSGTPSVTVDKSTDGTDVKFTFNFAGLKGEKGDRGEKGATGGATSGGDVDWSDLLFSASVDDTSGTPKVTVSKSQEINGENAGKTRVTFEFTGLKGEKGDKGDPGNGSASTSTAKMEIGKDNTVKYGLAIGQGNNVTGGLAVGYSNNVKDAGGLAVGHLNTAETDGAAIGNRIVAAFEQTVIGHNFAGLTQWQDQFTFNQASALPLIVATNSDQSSHDFIFAVAHTSDDGGGIILQGKNGASKAYYLLRIIGGSLSITDITSKIKFEAEK